MPQRSCTHMWLNLFLHTPAATARWIKPEMEAGISVALDWIATVSVFYLYKFSLSLSLFFISFWGAPAPIPVEWLYCILLWTVYVLLNNLGAIYCWAGWRSFLASGFRVNVIKTVAWYRKHRCGLPNTHRQMYLCTRLLRLQSSAKGEFFRVLFCRV